MLIGSRLRSLRQGMGISLRVLGERTDFSASFLSLVENDKASPSVSSLERIAAALGLSLAEFFLGAEEQAYQIVRAGERKNYTSEWSQTLVELLAQRPAGGALFPLLLRMLPGARSGNKTRPSFNEEFTLLLEGEVVLVLEDREERLEAGDSVLLPAGTARYWENRSGQVAVLLTVGHRAAPLRTTEAVPPPEQGEELIPSAAGESE